MPFQTEEATDFIALNTVVTTAFMEFTTVLTFVLIAFQTVLNTVLMAFITVDITEDMALITVVTTLFILFHTLITVSLQFSQIKRNGRVMMSNAASSIEPINITADTVPDALEKGLDIRPDLRPACAEPAQYDIRHAFQHIQDIGKERHHTVPNG